MRTLPLATSVTGCAAARAAQAPGVLMYLLQGTVLTASCKPRHPMRAIFARTVFFGNFFNMPPEVCCLPDFHPQFSWRRLRLSFPSGIRPQSAPAGKDSSGRQRAAPRKTLLMDAKKPRKSMNYEAHAVQYVVPRRGLEPPHLAAHGPEPCASTNSATWAYRLNITVCMCSGESITEFLLKRKSTL